MGDAHGGARSRMARYSHRSSIRTGHSEGNVPTTRIRIVTTTDRAGRAVTSSEDSAWDPARRLAAVFDPLHHQGGGKGTRRAWPSSTASSRLKGKSTSKARWAGDQGAAHSAPAQGAPGCGGQAALSSRCGVREEASLRVLLIDEKPPWALVRRCISRYWNASFVNDGRQALNCCATTGPDVIV